MPVTIHDITFDTEGYEEFWHDAPTWEPQTFEIFNQFIKENDIVIDMGAWIGPTVIYNALKSKCNVYAIEPDSVARAALIKNLELNNIQNVSVIGYPIGPRNEDITFGNRGEFGNSMSSLLFVDKPSTCKIKSKTFQTFLEEQNIIHCDFLKIDIEGGEFLILKDIVNALEKIGKPIIYMSFHQDFMREAPQNTPETKQIFDTAFHKLSSLYQQVQTDQQGITNWEEALRCIWEMSFQTFLFIP